MGRSLLRLKDRGVKMVSARTNNPGEFFPELKGEKGVLGEDVILDAFIPLYCVMCHRGLFSRIGGFVKNYPLCGYEDQELAYRMNHYGFKQAVCGRSWVRHEGAATVEAVCQAQFKAQRIMEANRETCVADMRRLKGKS
jgi:hypothetical protein